MEHNTKYTIIDKKSLADALNFMGFRYYIYDKDNKKVYSFEKNRKFDYALAKILELREYVKKI